MGARRTSQAKSGREAKTSRGKSSGAKATRGRAKPSKRKSRPGRWRTLGLTAMGMLLLGAFSIFALTFFLAFPLSGPDEPTPPTARTRPAKPAVSAAPAPSTAPAPERERATETGPSTEQARTAPPEPMPTAHPVWVGQASSDALPVELFVPPYGFGGTPWGRSLPSLSGTELLPGVGPFEHRRPMGETSFEDEPLQDVLLMLYDDKLAGVTLWLGSQDAYERVVTRLVGRYGPPRPGEALTWDWPDLGMAVAFMPTEGRGVVSISYKPLARQAAEAQESPPE